ncbi:hypothetical protein ACNKHM_06505 [Shigella sonnei]
MQWRTENPGVTLRAIHVHHGLSANADASVKTLGKHLPTVAGAAGGRTVGSLRKRG